VGGCIRYPTALYDSIFLDKKGLEEHEKHPDHITPSKIQRFEHKELIERNELWIVIVTGEAVLSIGERRTAYTIATLPTSVSLRSLHCLVMDM
jgi:hypothetical protein